MSENKVKFTDRTKNTDAGDSTLEVKSPGTTEGRSKDSEHKTVDKPRAPLGSGDTIQPERTPVDTKKDTTKDKVVDSDVVESGSALGPDHNVNFNEVNTIVTDVSEDDIEKLRIYTAPFKSFNVDAVGWSASLIDEGNTWDVEYTGEMMSFMAPEGMYGDRLTTGDWTNKLMWGDRAIGAQRPKIGTGGEISGASAVELITRKATGGGSITYPLDHSGFWITIEPPVESELIDLDHEILMSTTQVGNSTFGLLLNARSGVFSGLLIRFALSKVTWTSLKLPEGTDTDALLKYISPLDYGTIVNHVLVSMFTKGYPWEFTCSSSACKAKRSTLINLANAVWVDNSALTDKQLELMVKGRNSCRPDDVIKYQSLFNPVESNYVMLKDIGIHFKVGNMGDYLNSTARWIKKIELAYTNVLKDYTSESKRKSYINGQIQASRMNRYRHMVDWIEVGDSQIVDYDTITIALDTMSTVNEDWNVFEQAVIKFIEDSTIAIIGIPSHKCPTCNHLPTEQKGRFRSIIPIAPDRCFFTLIQQQAVMMATLVEA